MSGLRSHARLALMLFAAVVLGVGFHHSPFVSAKDQASKKKARPQKPTKKNAAESAGNSGQDGTSSGNASGAGIISGNGLPSAGSGQSGGNQATVGSAQSSSNGTGNTARALVQKGAPRPLTPDENPPHPDIVKRVMGVQDRLSADLVKQKGIAGTATALDEDGNVVVNVYTTGADDPIIPKQAEGVAVVEILTGAARPLCQNPAFDPTAFQPRPFNIGVGGTSETTGCPPAVWASGTIGCRLKDAAGKRYALGCNHDFAAENKGVIGDKCYQPGSGDHFPTYISCPAANVFGTLHKFNLLNYNFQDPKAINRIDAAVVATDTTMIQNSTPAPPVAYGTPKTSVWLEPFLGMKVQKYGKNTGLTRGTVTGLNQLVFMPYFSGIGRFTGQVQVIADQVTWFGIFGDSGALIVDMERFPVALLYGTIGNRASGNPIQEVLDFFDMTIDGEDVTGAVPGKIGRSTPNSP